MNDQNGSDLLLQTTWDIYQVLSEWEYKISRSHHLQLGSDVSLVQEMEDDLNNVSERVWQMDNQFDLRRVSVQQAKTYYLVKSRFKRAVQIMEQIRREAYGSFANTQLCLEQLRLCSESVQAMNHMISKRIPRSKYLS